MAREVPVTYVEQLTLNAVRGLSFRDRLRLLLGYNVKFSAVIYTQHKCGRTKQAVKIELTEKLPDAEPRDGSVVMVGGGK